MIQITKIEQRVFHRNGICGDPFLAVEFEFRDADHAGRAIATLPSTPDEDESDCRVVALDEDGRPDLTHCYRGDNFEGPLRAALARYRAQEVER